MRYGNDVLPGTGVTVAVVDSGIDLGHPAFKEATVSEIPFDGTPDETGEIPSHGTAVAGMIIGYPDPDRDPNHGYAYTGIAPGVKLEMIAFSIESPSFDIDNHEDYESILLRRNPDIMNMSFGTRRNLIEEYEEALLRATLRKTIEVLEQTDRTDKTILVWAAGNDHCRHPSTQSEKCDPFNDPFDATSPSIEAGLMTHIEELQGHSIAVVAIRETDGKIADFSNRCGIAADWCIAAPGEGVAVAYFGPHEDQIVQGYTLAGGTSYAAPMVAGGLALMKQMFRDQLPNTDLVTRLYETADGSGIYADETIYGRGLMDLGAAMAPVGDSTLTTGDRVDDPGHGLLITYLRPAGALSDGLSRSLAGREIVAFDALGAPFWYELADLVRTPSPTGRSSLGARLRDLMNEKPEGNPTTPGKWHFAANGSPTSSESSLLNLAGDASTLTFRARPDLEMSAFTTANADLPRQETPATGAILAWRPSDRAVGMQLGYLAESDGVLGSTARGAFGQLSADSFVAGLEVNTEHAGWHLTAGAELGLVEPNATGGLIADVSTLTTSALSLRAERPLTKDDKLTITIAQPPRVERGRANLTVPTGRTKDGTVLHESVAADLVPSGRQVDVAAGWNRTGVLNGKLRTQAYISHRPGHRDTKPVFGLLAGWRLTF